MLECHRKHCLPTTWFYPCKYFIRLGHFHSCSSKDGCGRSGSSFFNSVQWYHLNHILRDGQALNAVIFKGKQATAVPADLLPRSRSKLATCAKECFIQICRYSVRIGYSRHPHRTAFYYYYRSLIRRAVQDTNNRQLPRPQSWNTAPAGAHFRSETVNL